MAELTTEEVLRKPGDLGPSAEELPLDDAAERSIPVTRGCWSRQLGWIEEQLTIDPPPAPDGHLEDGEPVLPELAHRLAIELP